MLPPDPSTDQPSPPSCEKSVVEVWNGEDCPAVVLGRTVPLAVTVLLLSVPVTFGGVCSVPDLYNWPPVIASWTPSAAVLCVLFP